MEDNSILIIPNEDKKLILEENGIYERKFYSKECDHATKFREFCDYYFPNIKLSNTAIGDDYARVLSQFGCLTYLQWDDMAIMYIPTELSTNQQNWLHDNYLTLFNYYYLDTSIWIRENNILRLKQYLHLDFLEDDDETLIPVELENIINYKQKGV